MTLYEVFDQVSQALSPDKELQKQIIEYLKNSMDDDLEFTRSRYQKRPEGPISNRELGVIKYIICGSIKPFHPNQLQYTSDQVYMNLINFQAEIIWNKSIENFQEDQSLLIESGYKNITIIEGLGGKARD